MTSPYQELESLGFEWGRICLGRPFERACRLCKSGHCNVQHSRKHKLAEWVNRLNTGCTEKERSYDISHLSRLELGFRMGLPPEI
jgi:hypothetical protein